MKTNFNKTLIDFYKIYQIKEKNKLIIFFELIFPYFLIIITIQFFLKGNSYWIKFITIPIILIFIIINQKKLNFSLNNQGLLPKEWKKPILYIFFPTLILSILIIIINRLYIKNNLKYSIELIIYVSIFGYPFWAFIQQYILIVYTLPRIIYFIKNHYLVFIITAFLFSSVHLPNPFLFILTFFATFFFIYFFIKYKNLYILAFIHGFCGAILKFFLPDKITLKFWIGNLITWSDFFNYFK